MNDSQIFDWFWTGSFDDNAGVSAANANATAPLISDAAGQASLSTTGRSWLDVLNNGLTAASDAYVATTRQDQLRANQATTATGNSRLLVIGGIALAVIVGLVFLFRRK